MTMKKKILTTLSVVLVLGLAALGILAYLQDEDSDVNVMTLGNVQIEQIEQEWKNGELVDFTQAKPLYPYVGTLGWKGEVNNSSTLAEKAYRQFAMNNVVDKYVSVKNTGKSEAYIRTVFAMEMGEYTEVEDFRNKVVGFSRNVENGDEFKFPGAWVWGTPFVAKVDGHNYMIWEAVHQTALESEDVTIPSLLQVYMNSACGNDEVTKVDGNKNGTYDILVVSQAVQKDGFDTAEAALTAGFGAVSEAKAQEWFGKLSIPPQVATADELIDAIEAGKSVVLKNDIELTETVNIEKATTIDLNGHELTVTILEAKADTVIKDGDIVTAQATYPNLSVSNGILNMENVDIITNHYCNLVTNNGLEASEYTGLEVWSGKAILNNCKITVNVDKKRYSNSVFGVGIHGGEFTMNGGSITINNPGSNNTNYDYEAAIFAGSNTKKMINLNNVDITSVQRTLPYHLFAWGGNTTVTTTDADNSWNVDVRNGGVHTINYVK